MRKIIFFILIFFLFIIHVNAQDDSKNNNESVLLFSTRLGVNTFNELNFQLQKSISNKIGLELYFGYNYGSNFFMGGIFSCSDGTIISTRKTGPIVKIGTVFYNENSLKGPWKIFLDLRKSEAFPIGNNCSDDSFPILGEYRWDVFDAGLMIYRDRVKSRSKYSNWYYGIGCSFRFGEIDYTYGPSTIPFISLPEDYRFTRLVFRLDIGIRLTTSKENKVRKKI